MCFKNIERIIFKILKIVGFGDGGFFAFVLLKALYICLLIFFVLDNSVNFLPYIIFLPSV